MEINILAFGIAREILGTQQVAVEVPDGLTAVGLKQHLVDVYPQFGRLKSFAIAVNGAYAQDGVVLAATDEIAIIPPVSGG